MGSIKASHGNYELEEGGAVQRGIIKLSTDILLSTCGCCVKMASLPMLSYGDANIPQHMFVGMLVLAIDSPEIFDPNFWRMPMIRAMDITRE